MRNSGQTERRQSELRRKGLEGGKAQIGAVVGEKCKRRHLERNKV